MTSRWGTLLEGLDADDRSLEDVLAARRPAREAAMLRRCAVVRSFDRELFDAVLIADLAEPPPAFDDLAASSAIHAVPRHAGVYRVTASARSRLWAAWWDDDPTVPLNKLPTALRTLLERLVDYFAKHADPLELLAARACVDPDSAAHDFAELYDAADRRLDLPGCQDLIDVLGDVDRGPLLGERLRRLRDERQGYLRARNLWSAEYFRTARYLEPDGAASLYEGLLQAQKLRAIHLHAPGGRGKTMQLQWLVSRRLVPDESLGALAGGRIPCAMVDFDFVDAVQVAAHPWLVLVEIADQLSEQLPNRQFTSFLDGFDWVPPLLRPLASSGDAAKAAARQLRLITPERVRDTVALFTSILSDVSGGRPIVLVLDTLEELHLRPEAQLRALIELVHDVMEGAPELRLILAGRYPVTAVVTDVKDRLPAFEEVELPPFDDGQADRYLLKLRELNSKPLRDAIIAKAKGDPLLLAMLADAAQVNPEISPEEIAHHPADVVYLIRRIVLRIHQPGVRWLLRYGVVPRTLTLSFVRDVMEPYLRTAMAGASTVDAPTDDEFASVDETGPLFRTDLLGSAEDPLDLDTLWQDLRRYAGSTAWVFPVRKARNTLQFRAEVINPMRRVIREHEVYERLHRDAKAHYEAKAMADGAGWADATRAAIYHEFQLSGPAAITYWGEALRQAGGNAERRASIAAEILGRDYLDEGQQALPWRDGQPMVDTATLLDARAEHAVALTELARRRGVPPDDPQWSSVETSYTELEKLRSESGGGDPADPRPAFVRAALELKRGEHNRAARTARAALEDSIEPEDRLRLEVLLADAELLGGARRRAADRYERALAIGETLADPPDWLQSLRRDTMLVKADVDALDDALAEYERALPAIEQPAERAELEAAAAGILLRCGELTAADALAERATASGYPGASGVRVRAALARLDAPGALSVARAAGDPSSPQTAELVGVGAGAHIEYKLATEALELARRGWSAEGESQAVVRCSNTLAALELQQIGDLGIARYLLAEAARVPLAPVSPERITTQLLRAELEARSGDRVQASALLQSLLRELQEQHAPPRSLVAVAVATLAHGDPDHHNAALDVLAKEAARITPASARVVAISKLDRVPTRPQLHQDRRLQRLREQLGPDHPSGLPALDCGVLSLTRAELDRVLGDRDAALSRLMGAERDLEPSPNAFWVRAFARALDRVDAPLPPELIDGFTSQFADSPLLCAVFLIERAEAAQRSGPPAAQWIDEAARLIARTGGKTTQWHMRLALLQEKSAQRDGDVEAAAQARATAERTARALGVPAPEGPEVVDAALSELRRGCVTLVIAASPSGGLTAAARLSLGAAGLPPVELGFRKPADVVLEVRRRWSMAPIAAVELLRELILPDTVSAAFSRVEPLRETRLEVSVPELQPLPWELALTSDGLLSRGRPVLRASPDPLALQYEVQLVQTMLTVLTEWDIPVDGALGPQTRAALRDFQERTGLRADGVLRRDVFDRLQSDVAARTERGTVVIVQPSLERQVINLRSKSSSGADLRRHYEGNGLRTYVLEEPTVPHLRGAVEELRPAILHLSAALRETTAGVELTFLAGSRHDAHEPGDEFSVTAVNAVLGEVPTAMAPVVILDIDSPFSAPEVFAQLELRNRFAGDLIAHGRCPAVLATGLVAGDPFGFYDTLMGGLGKRDALCDIAAALQGLRSYGLTEPAGAATALFTSLPWLRPIPH